MPPQFPRCLFQLLVLSRKLTPILGVRFKYAVLTRHFLLEAFEKWRPPISLNPERRVYAIGTNAVVDRGDWVSVVLMHVSHRVGVVYEDVHGPHKRVPKVVQ